MVTPRRPDRPGFLLWLPDRTQRFRFRARNPMTDRIDYRIYGAHERVSVKRATAEERG